MVSGGADAPTPATSDKPLYVAYRLARLDTVRHVVLCDLPMEVAKAPMGNVKGSFTIHLLYKLNNHFSYTNLSAL